MDATLEFPDLLRLIEERSATFCDLVTSAPSLDLQVPTCPEWSLFDLVEHLGDGRRAWAATVTAGPDATTKADGDGVPAPRDREALVAWMGASTQQLVDALRDAGPDRACWSWWEDSQSPSTSGSVARHQLQQMAVHTYDAQATVGEPLPLSEEVALDGVDEFLHTCCSTTSPWPHEATVVDYETREGRSWRVRLSAEGAKVDRLSAAEVGTGAAPGPGPADGGPGEGGPGEGVRYLRTLSTANELVLLFYGRIPVRSLEVSGDPEILEQLADWEP